MKIDTMDRFEILETRKYACVAEAVADWLKEGFRTDENHQGIGRKMVFDRELGGQFVVVIGRTGFLEATATAYDVPASAVR
jgi:hypothetical protein